MQEIKNGIDRTHLKFVSVFISVIFVILKCGQGTLGIRREKFDVFTVYSVFRIIKNNVKTPIS